MTDCMLDSPHVLVVEDEALIAIELALTLEDAGAKVIGPAATVDQALKLLAEHRPDVAVLDVLLGGVDVGPVAAALTRIGVPFIFQTGHADAAMLATWPNAPILRKPVPSEQLIGALTRITRR